MSEKSRDQTPEIMDAPMDRRTLNVTLGTGFLNQVDQTRKCKNESAGVTGTKKQWLPLPLRALSFIGGILLFLGCLGMILYFAGSFLNLHNFFLNDPTIFGINLTLGVVVYGGLRLLESYLERRDWVRRMREEDAKKQKR